jgi:hypothetical protein
MTRTRPRRATGAQRADRLPTTICARPVATVRQPCHRTRSGRPLSSRTGARPPAASASSSRSAASNSGATASRPRPSARSSWPAARTRSEERRPSRSVGSPGVLSDLANGSGRIETPDGGAGRGQDWTPSPERDRGEGGLGSDPTTTSPQEASHCAEAQRASSRSSGVSNGSSSAIRSIVLTATPGSTTDGPATTPKRGRPRNGAQTRWPGESRPAKESGTA